MSTRAQSEQSQAAQGGARPRTYRAPKFGTLGLLILLCSGGAFAEEPAAATPKAAPTTTVAPTSGTAQGKPTMKPLGAKPEGGPHGTGPHAAGPHAAGPHGPGPASEKGDAPPKGPTSPEERATRALVRARERLEASAKQAAAEEGEPDAKTRAQRRAARRAFLRAQHDLRKNSGTKFELKGEQKDVVKGKLEADMKAETATRSKRLAAEQAKVKKAYGPALGHTPIHRELRRHAWRVARLNRTVDIAGAADRKDLTERATALLTAENARHDKRMKDLMAFWKKAGSPKGVLPSQAAQAAAASQGAPGATPPAATKPTPPPAPAPAASPAHTEGK